MIRTKLCSLIELTELYKISLRLRGQEAHLVSTIFLETCMILTRKRRSLLRFCQQQINLLHMLWPHWGKRSFDISTAQSDLKGLFWMNSEFHSQDAQGIPKLPIQNLKPMNTQYVVDVATPERAQEHSHFSACSEHFNFDGRTLHINGSAQFQQ